MRGMSDARARVSRGRASDRGEGAGAGVDVKESMIDGGRGGQDEDVGEKDVDTEREDKLEEEGAERVPNCVAN